jgi:hypothetical protein
MKLEVGLLNELTVADSWESLVNPSLVRMRHPAEGGALIGREKDSYLFALAHDKNPAFA